MLRSSGHRHRNRTSLRTSRSSHLRNHRLSHNLRPFHHLRHRLHTRLMYNLNPHLNPHRSHTRLSYPMRTPTPLNLRSRCNRRHTTLPHIIFHLNLNRHSSLPLRCHTATRRRPSPRHRSLHPKVTLTQLLPPPSLNPRSRRSLPPRRPIRTAIARITPTAGHSRVPRARCTIRTKRRSHSSSNLSIHMGEPRMVLASRYIIKKRAVEGA